MSLIVGIRPAEGLVLATDSLLRRADAAFFTPRKPFVFSDMPEVAVAICGLLSLEWGDMRSIAAERDGMAQC